MHEERNLPYPLLMENFQDLQASIHYSDSVTFPAIPEAWSERYAGELAYFFLHDVDPKERARKQALVTHLTSHDWQKDRNSSFFTEMHLAEAEARDITPWTLSIFIQAETDLYEGGHIGNEDLVQLRSQLLKEIQGVDHPEKRPLQEIGETAATFLYSSGDFWSIRQVDSLKALQFEDFIRQHLGEDMYFTLLIHQLVETQGRSQYRPYLEQQLETIRSQYEILYNQFRDSLHEEEQRQLDHVRSEASNRVFERNLQQQENSLWEKLLGMRKRKKQSQDS